MKKMYNWIKKHKLFLIVVLLLSPISGIVLSYALVKSLEWFGVSSIIASYPNILAFYGTVLGSAVTLIAVMITIDDTLRYKLREENKATIPILVLEPINDNIESVLLNDHYKMQFIFSNSNVSTDNNIFDTSRKDYFYLTNFGTASAVNITVHIKNDNHYCDNSNYIFSLFPRDKALLCFAIDSTVASDDYYQVEFKCSSILGERISYKTHYGFTFDETGKSYISTKLMPDIEKFQRESSTTVQTTYKFFSKRFATKPKVVKYEKEEAWRQDIFK